MTTMTATLMQTDLPLPGRRQGKVRDIYEATTTAGAEALLIIRELQNVVRMEF